MKYGFSLSNDSLLSYDFCINSVSVFSFHQYFKGIYGLDQELMNVYLMLITGIN